MCSVVVYICYVACIYNSLVKPIASYGCETWTPRQTKEKKLSVFEMTALGLQLGVTKLDKLRNEKSESSYQ